MSNQWTESFDHPNDDTEEPAPWTKVTGSPRVYEIRPGEDGTLEVVRHEVGQAPKMLGRTGITAQPGDTFRLEVNSGVEVNGYLHGYDSEGHPTVRHVFHHDAREESQ